MNKKTSDTRLTEKVPRRFWGSLQFKLPVYFSVVTLFCYYFALAMLSYIAHQEMKPAQIQQFDEWLMQVVIFGTCGIIVATCFFIFYIRQRLSKPLQWLAARADEIAQGRYDATDVIHFSTNELLTLNDSLSDLGFKVKDVHATTQAQRQRLDSVLTHMSDGVIATDRRGNIVLSNDAAETLLNKHRDELLNQSIMDVFQIRNQYTFRQLLETSDELIFSEMINGIKTIIRVEFSVIRRQSGFISGIVCVLSDITEQEKIEQERKEFVSNVSHELRTPLTSMRSYTEALIDGAWQDESLAPNFLNVIQSETNRLIRMVSDLLNLSHLEDGNSNITLETIDFTEVFQRICDRYEILLQSAQYKHKGYQLDRQIAPHSCWIEADEDKLIQVVDNILNNAIKYSPDGGVIKCQLMTTETHVVMSISDDGLGIPMSALPNVFKRFYRVDKARSREQGGTGLGLAIAKEVVELHQGKIWVSSREGKGSTFFVSLPKAQFDDDWEEDM